MENFISATISAIVSGIIVVIYETYSNKRLRRIEAKYEMIVSANKEQYKMALQMMKDIWAEIDKAEDFIKNGMSSQIKEAAESGSTELMIDSSVLSSAYNVINQKSIFMPSTLIEKTKELFHYYVKIHNGYIDLANNVISGKATLDELNRYIPYMLEKEKYVKDKELLKTAYHERVRSLLFEEF